MTMTMTMVIMVMTLFLISNGCSLYKIWVREYWRLELKACSFSKSRTARNLRESCLVFRYFVFFFLNSFELYIWKSLSNKIWKIKKNKRALKTTKKSGKWKSTNDCNYLGEQPSHRTRIISRKVVSHLFISLSVKCETFISARKKNCNFSASKIDHFTVHEW